MSAIEGYQCDYCGHRETQSASNRFATSFKMPQSGWMVSKMPETPEVMNALWFCSNSCVRGYLVKEERS